jgi:ELWxxDGT repeat protein
MFRTFFFCFALLFFSSISFAQKGLVEYEIRKGFYGSNPTGFTEAYGKLFFTAFTDADQYQTYYCDGANAPALLNKMGLTVFGAVNGKLYLLKKKATWLNQYDLYEYDGVNTPVFITPLGDPADTLSPGTAMPINGKLYFNIGTKSPGPVYRTEIKSFDPVANQLKVEYTVPNAANFDNLTVFQDKIFFSATTVAEGIELHVFDPATSVESIVADINPGNKNSWPEYFKVAGNMLFFRAQEDVYSRELYMYDGTNPPKRLTDIQPGTGYGVNNPSPVSLNGNIYFMGQNAPSRIAIYKYEPGTGNVTLACDVAPGKNAGITELAVYGDKIYFGANQHNGTGIELLSYDLVGPPVLMADARQPGSSVPRGFVQYNLSLYFIGDDEGAGQELYKFTDSVVSIKDARAGEGLKLYPNPAGDILNIEISLDKGAMLDIVVTDLNGREVFSARSKFANGRNVYQVPVGHLAAGAYQYHVTGEAGILYGRGSFIKE